jgi:tight adherence protein C
VSGLVALLFAVAAVAALEGLIGAGVRGRSGSRDRRDRKPSSERESPPAAISLGLPDRIRRAGKDGDLSPRSLLVAKGLTASTGFCAGMAFSGLAPGRSAPLLVAGFACLGFLLPDLMLERVARRRHRSMVAALPDALDLLAVSVSGGRTIGAAFLELAESGRGPLARELGRTGEEIAWGSGQGPALEALRHRVKGPEVASFCATLERSRRLGSPLAEQLRRQASAMRKDQRRGIEEEAARAAPKIQLVIALVLVPAVLLLMVAALVANGDSLTGFSSGSI